MTLVANSGKEVPNATANKDIKDLDKPKEFAKFIADSTKKCPPKGSKIHPKINRHK